MIFIWIINAFVAFASIIFSWLPHVTTLPWGIDDFLVTTMGYWYAFLQVFWPLQIIWTFCIVYFTYRLSLIVLKFILGHRIAI